jgi:hypothetical protein
MGVGSSFTIEVFGCSVPLDTVARHPNACFTSPVLEFLLAMAKINDPSLRRWRWKDFRQERSIKGEIQDFYDASTVKCLNVSREFALGHQLTKRSCCMRQLGKNSAIHIQILHLPSSQKNHLL